MITLKKKYLPLITNDTRIFIVTGGRGSAKSFSVSTFLCLLSFEDKQRILYTRQTMTSAHLSIIPEFQEKISLMESDDKFTVNKTEIINNESGSEIIFKGIQSSSGNNTANLKSLSGISCWVVDEAEEMKDESVFDKINLSIRTKGVQNRIILILNPSTKESWIYQRFFEKAGVNPGFNGVQNNVTYIHTDYRDNINHLDESFLSQVEDIRVNNPDKYKHVILGGWLSKAEGVIYENWSIGEFNTSLPTTWGADFGFSIDPTTLIKCAVDNKSKTIYLHECVYKPKMATNDIYLSYLRECGNEGLITADSAEPRLISELRDKGLNIKACIKGPGSITAGISAIQDYKIIITPQSTNLSKELSNYVWNDKKAAVPMDAFNHLLDAMRYAVYPIIKSKRSSDNDFFAG